MRLTSFAAVLAGLIVSGACCTMPALAQSDMPIIANITVPVQFSFIDTESMGGNTAPQIRCDLEGSTPGLFLGSGFATVPMVSTQATATTRSVSSFSGNVIVAIHSKPSMNAPGLSGETAAQSSARFALANAKTYVCNLGAADSASGRGAGSYKFTEGYRMASGENTRPTASVLVVKGPFIAPK